VSRFIAEMALDVGDAPPKETEIISPRERLARMKELLSAPRDINAA
jgi:ATP-dependent DNA helicase Rep